MLQWFINSNYRKTLFICIYPFVNHAMSTNIHTWSILWTFTSHIVAAVVKPMTVFVALALVGVISENSASHWPLQDRCTIKREMVNLKKNLLFIYCSNFSPCLASPLQWQVPHYVMLADCYNVLYPCWGDCTKTLFVKCSWILNYMWSVRIIDCFLNSKWI